MIVNQDKLSRFRNIKKRFDIYSTAILNIKKPINIDNIKFAVGVYWHTQESNIFEPRIINLKQNFIVLPPTEYLK